MARRASVSGYLSMTVEGIDIRPVLGGAMFVQHFGVIEGIFS